MSFNVSAITGYVKANEKQLLAKAVLKGKTIDTVKYQPEVKGSAQINLISGGGTLQAGGCGWNAAGTTTFTKRNIVTGLLKVNEAYCDTDLRGTFAEWELNIAVGKETLPFEQVIAESALANVNKQIDNLAWNGDTTGSTSTYLDVTDGYIKIIGAASGVIDATVSGKTLAADTIVAIDAIVAGIPNEIIEESDLTIFAGQEIVRKYIAAYNATNQFAGVIQNDGKLDIMIPNTNVRLLGVSGLNGKNKAYASKASNFYAGGDIAGSESQYKLWYSDDNQEFRFALKTNIGFQVAFPDFVVKYTA